MTARASLTTSMLAAKAYHYVYCTLKAENYNALFSHIIQAVLCTTVNQKTSKD